MAMIGLPTPPPSVPVYSSGQWDSVEAQLGTVLPSDYKNLVSSYGDGIFDEFLWIYTPFTPHREANLIHASKVDREVLMETRNFPGHEQVAVFPEPNGLLACGGTGNGDRLFWKTVGLPDVWTIVVRDSRAPEAWEHHGNLISFLQLLLSRKKRCPIFPSDFPSVHPAFKPARL